MNNEIKIDDFSELIQYISSLNNEQMIYRGYSFADELLPQLFRNKGYEKSEKSMLQDFEKYVSLFFALTSAEEFYVLAQHYGLPTRLIDFTFNPLIALFFAINREDNPESGYYKILCLDKNDYEFVNLNKSLTRYDYFREKNNSGTLKLNNYNSYTDEVLVWLKKANGQRKLIPVLNPIRLNNSRIFNQQGLFVVCFSKNTLNENCGKKILVNKNLKIQLLNYLSIRGIDELHLFYNLDNLIDSIKEKYKKNLFK